jgi:uncharacterized RDD family membrane protein YckC
MQDFDFIETPENVELQRKLAGIGTRFIAGLLDNLIIFAIFLVLFLLGLFSVGAGAMFSSEAGAVVIGFLIVVMFVVYWGYFAFFEMVTNGQSPGKKSQSIRVVKDGGGAITFIDIAIRNLLRAVDFLGMYAVAGIFMFITRKSQRLGDLAAGTVVILEAVSDYSARSGRKKSVQWEEEATAEVLRATQLTPEEYRVLRNYWQRRNELSLPARRRLLQQLVQPILKRAGQLRGDESIPQLEHALAALMRTVAHAKAEAGPGQSGGVQ